MNTISLIALPFVMLILGFLLGKLTIKPSSGRIVINESEDEIFVAITDKPEEIKKKNHIYLKVYVAKRGE